MIAQARSSLSLDRRRAAALLAGAPTLLAGGPCDTSPSRKGVLEVVARIGWPVPSGLAVSPSGRLFVSFPRYSDAHSHPSVVELKDERQIAFPDAATSLVSAMPADRRLVSAHGMTTDRNGRIWVVDVGKIAGAPIEPGGPKIMGVDPETGRIAHAIVLQPSTVLADSHMNDLRIDLSHGHAGVAYVTDSSFGVSPALVVVDIASGRQRRVLGEHPSVRAEPGFLAVLDGTPHRYSPHGGGAPFSGANGITLSLDEQRLFYGPLTSRRLYSIPTDILSDLDASEDALASAVRDEGEKGMSDGLATGPDGSIYVTASEHEAILRRHPDGQVSVVAVDPRIVWPDGIFVAGEHVYFTCAQSQRKPEFNAGRDRRQPPFLLMRASIRSS